MDDFKALIIIIERLLAPDGCPWDREQTLQSMRRSLVEETYEVIEAIDLNDNHQIEEELGDLFFNAIFLSKLAERDNRFSLEDVLKQIAAKLIRRHPHIFGEAQVGTAEEVLKQWEEIKKKEKGEAQPQSALDNIPKDLPSLARAYKMLKKFEKAGFSLPRPNEQTSEEDRLGLALLELVQHGIRKGIDAEHALRRLLSHLNQQFRAWEQANPP
ncbi:MazG family protein [Candidatus Protochlamydia phocaeensis]|uniref:MazG family protein n=1 Tax=Candidatus Protochlamydia phocaeensis TaxID=1414722 RepID=UPI00083843A9|nr:MazG family protein [Candidatus Protochlamydia phocaeensis]